MAKKVKARLDTKGLTALGLEKLVEILLEESVANKALKARLQAALAGTSGPEDIILLIDKRLDTLESAKTSINGARARDLTVELSAFIRNIQSELGSIDQFAAFERLMRVMALRTAIEHRLKSDSARLMKVFTDLEGVLAELLPTLPEEAQLRAVETLEKDRKRDRYGERSDFFAAMLGGMAKPAADAWQGILEGQFKAGETGPFLSRLLQRLYLKNGDLDAYITLEKARPENRQDSFAVAAMLHQAARLSEALDWVRKKTTGIRTLPVNGVATSVGPDYQARERRLLEAEILDGLKQRDAAQAIRWQEFLKTLDASILRRYIAKLDDFAEFDELDKAFAAVLQSQEIYPALDFLVEWPRLDLAAEHTLKHTKKWDGREYEYLTPAADALASKDPVAATILYRALLNAILIPSNGEAYPHAARYLTALADLSSLLPEQLPFESHAAFIDEIRRRHGRKHSFWELLPAQLR
jgi:hypothetical protein